MAFINQDPFTKKVTDLPDKPSPLYTAAEIKTHFQTPADELKTTFNALVDKLNATTDGDSGADNLRATAISGLTGTNVQTILESIPNSDHKGTWQGFTPTQVDQALTSRVNYLEDKTTNELHINEFIPSGTTPSDYTLILQDAINEAGLTDKKLLLEGGKSYTITAQLLVTSACSIESDSSNRAVIKVNDQSFDPIKVSGAIYTESTLSASATVNTKWVDLNSTTGLVPGMLLEIISSKSWYHDPRPESSDCRKAELHRIDDVSGNRVYLTDPLMDGYNITLETVTVKSYIPVRFHMANIDVVMTKSPVPNDSTRKTGITLEHTVDALLENVYVTNAQNCGIFLKHSYRPTVIGGRTEGANNYFSGYGVQTYGTTHAHIKDRHFRNCRRGVDLSGGNIPSHYSVVEGNSCFGTGKNSMGDPYVYTDSHTAGAAASGFGTHGGADHTIFRDNYMGFLEIGIVDRSRNTIIENNYFVGDFRSSCIDVSFGENGIIKENKVYDGFTGLKESSVFDGGANANTRKSPIFIRYQDTALVNGSSGFYVVEDNFVMVQHTFIDFYGTISSPAIPTLSNFVVKGNHCFFTPQNSTDDAVFIRNSVASATVILASGSKVKENTIKRLTGTGGCNIYKDVDIRDGSEIESPRTFSFFLLDDTATSVDFGAGGTSTYARVMLDSSYASGAFRLIRDTAGLSSWWGTENTNLNGVATALTGTTGTDGKINLSFLSNGKLYVENRSASTLRITVTIMNYI